jgi:hypothetical protein
MKRRNACRNLSKVPVTICPIKKVEKRRVGAVEFRNIKFRENSFSFPEILHGGRFGGGKQCSIETFFANRLKI